MKPRPHQDNALKRMADKSGFALFHEMGTGKTFTTLMDMAPRLDSGDVSRLLVMCPLSVIPSWLGETEAHTQYRATAIRGSKLKRRQIIESDARILVMNYDLLHTHFDELLAANFDALVADESQRLISPSNLWTKAALKLSKEATIKRALTGTPIRHFELDLYNQMRFIDPDILPWRSHFAFKKQFAIEMNRGGFSQVVGVRNAEEIKRRCAPFCDYVSFDDAFPGMAEWVDMVRIVPMTAEQGRVFKDLKKDLLTKINGNDITAQNAAVQINRLAQVSGGTIKDADGNAHILGSKKMDELKDVLAQVNGQVIIWVKYRAEAEWISREIGAPFIHGDVTGNLRDRLLKEFRQRVHPAMVCQLDTLSEGVNELSNADAEVRWSYDWSYLTWAQSRARMRRANRTNPKPCRSIQLLTEGSTDERIILAVGRKEDVSVTTLQDIRSLLV